LRQLRRFDHGHLRRALSVILAAGMVSIAFVSPTPKAQANTGPTPKLWLDATNSASYSGTGSTWTDLSPNGANGTIVGGVIYNAQNEAFQFPGGLNGQGGYVSLNTNMNDFSAGMTIEFEGEFGAVRSNWERIFDFALNIDNQPGGISNIANAIWVGQFDNFNEMTIEVFSNGVSNGYCYTTTNGTALGAVGDRSFNKWLITLSGSAPTLCRIYKNGVEIPTRATTYAARNFNPTGANANGSTYALPVTTSRPSNFLGRSNFAADSDLEGSIRYIRIYDQALTAQEAVQNTSSTVTFLPNGGTGTMASQSGLSSAALTLNTFTRSGFSFSGWNTDQNGNGTPYVDGETYSFASNMTLYAQWTQDPTTTIAATTTVAPTTTIPAATTTLPVATTTVAPTTTLPAPTTTTVNTVATNVALGVTTTIVAPLSAQGKSENDSIATAESLPVSGFQVEQLLGWITVLVMLGIGLLLSPARRRLD